MFVCLWVVCCFTDIVVLTYLFCLGLLLGLFGDFSVILLLGLVVCGFDGLLGMYFGLRVVIGLVGYLRVRA